jgi:hypothetical protein
MTDSCTISDSESFTVAHARHIAAKVAADLKRIQRLYGSPGDASIADYEAEVIEFVKAGYLGTVWYGYRRTATGSSRHCGTRRATFSDRPRTMTTLAACGQARISATRNSTAI